MTLEIIRGDLQGRQIRINLHDLKLPSGELAHRMEGRDLYRSLKRLGVPGISPNSGHQDLLWQYGLFLRETNPDSVKRPWEISTQVGVKP